MSKYDDVTWEVKSELYKYVVVLGEKVIVPKWVRYIAVNPGGEVHCYEEKPEKWEWWMPDSYLDTYDCLGQVEMKPRYDWREMIWEV